MNDEMIAIQEMEKAKQRLEQKSPSKLGTVNMSRLIKDWTEIVESLKRNLNYPIKHQRVYPYLLEDIMALPLDSFRENCYIELPCGIKLNVLTFKADFDEGIKDIKNQIKMQREAKLPVSIHIDDLIDVMEYSQSFKELMKYTFRFAFNKEKSIRPEIKKADVSFKADNLFIRMYIGEKEVSKMSLSINEEDDLFVL